MKSTSIVTVWVSSIILLLTLVAITVPLAHAQMTLNITRADADKPYGREKLGTVLIVPKEHVPIRFSSIGLFTINIIN